MGARPAELLAPLPGGATWTLLPERCRGRGRAAGEPVTSLGDSGKQSKSR